MASIVAWLDFSEDEQRRAREIVQLFSQPDSRDELGIGTIRDALSDAMFPGISVLQSRARYFLFIPWLFREGERRGRRGGELLTWVQHQERRLVEALRRGGDLEGLIGRLVGMRLKIVPSTIYWTGLQRFGVLRHGGTPAQVADAAGKSPSIEDALTELVDRGDGLWDPNLPRPPAGFFEMDVASFGLTGPEADWVSERIVASVPGTLLAWLAESNAPLAKESEAAWSEPLVGGAPRAIREIVVHAERFSLLLQGAALLYNLLVAERARHLGLDPAGETARKFEGWLSEWSDEIDANRSALASWDVGGFWELVLRINPRVSLPTRLFVDRWIALVLDASGPVSRHDEARRLVGARERQQKGSQSRLVNDRLLRQWGGSSGADRLTFRWGQVKRILNDVCDGRRSHAGA